MRFQKVSHYTNDSLMFFSWMLLYCLIIGTKFYTLLAGELNTIQHTIVIYTLLLYNMCNSLRISRQTIGINYIESYYDNYNEQQ